MYKIVQASESLIETFLRDLEHGAIHFRYYQKRPIQVINDHLHTIVMVDEAEIPIAYGHLEIENNITWLGLAVADKQTNKGLGKVILQNLIDFATRSKIPVLYLSVDADNYFAQKLYTSFGFEKARDVKDYFIFQLKLN